MEDFKNFHIGDPSLVVSATFKHHFLVPMKYFLCNIFFHQSYFLVIKHQRSLAPIERFIKIGSFIPSLPCALGTLTIIQLTKWNFSLLDFPYWHKNLLISCAICFLIPMGAKRDEYLKIGNVDNTDLIKPNTL